MHQVAGLGIDWSSAAWAVPALWPSLIAKKAYDSVNPDTAQSLTPMTTPSAAATSTPAQSSPSIYSSLFESAPSTEETASALNNTTLVYGLGAIALFVMVMQANKKKQAALKKNPRRGSRRKK
jgi:hypothetical protein